VASATPGLWGWSGHPERPKKKKKKKKRKKWVWDFGGGRTTPRAWGWLRTPPTAGRGCPKPPPGPRGWSGHPQNPKPIFFVFFFFFLAFRGGRTTPKGLGWLRPPPYDRYGVAEATPWPKMGWPATPYFGQGVAPATPISPFFFFLVFFPSFFH
jgi:hypothetical protein